MFSNNVQTLSLYNPNLPTNSTNRDYFNVTESSQINTELHSTFKDIYKLQTNLNHTKNALADYLNSDGDTAPMEELQRRKLPRALKQSMEGLLTIKELTEAVMVSMNGNSSPGCDGFTVNHLREF